MSCTPLLKAAKPVWAKQLTRLPCLVVYAKFQFVHIIGREIKEGFCPFMKYDHNPFITMTTDTIAITILRQEVIV